MDVAAAIGSTMRGAIGPTTGCKIVCEDEASFQVTSDPLFILRHISCQGPILTIIHDAAYYHHKTFGHCTKTFLLMISLFASCIASLQDQGVRIAMIDQELRRLVSDCTLTLQISAIPLSAFAPPQQQMKIQPRFSRYSTASPATTSQSWKIALQRLGEALAHGMQNEMKMVIDVIIQMNLAVERLIDVNVNVENIVKITKISIVNPYKNAIVKGVVIAAEEQACKLVKMMSHCRILLFRCDLMKDYIHPGYLKRHKETVTMTGEAMKINTAMSAKAMWVKKTKDILIRSKANVILVSGHVCDELQSLLFLCGIVIVSRVPHNILSQLQENLQILSFEYADDVSEDSASADVAVSTINFSLDSLDFSQSFIQIVIPTFCSVLFSGPSQWHIDETQRRFDVCLSRIKTALQDGKVLKGGGEAELICIKQLQKLALINSDESLSSILHPFICSILSNAFSSFRECLRCNLAALGNKNTVINSTDEIETVTVVDCLSSKINSLERSLSTVLLILKCDRLIVNGNATQWQALVNDDCFL